MAFVHRQRVRWRECDPQGIVFNANYVAYVDDGLTELWRAAFGGYDDVMREHGVDLVVAEVHQRFRGSARFDDELSIELTLEQIGTTSITTQTTIARDGEVLVDGSIRHVCVDRDTLTKHPVPDAIRAGIEAAAG